MNALSFHGTRAPLAYSNSIVSHFAKAVKVDNKVALLEAAKLMAPLVPRNATLVPVPSSKGKGGSGYLLAATLASLTGCSVVEALNSKPRASLYHVKKSGRMLRPEDLGMFQDTNCDLQSVLLIDNVAGSHTTLEAARQALKTPAQALVLAMSNPYFDISSLSMTSGL
jgi:predicted amidophosphoribosyltransferase